VFYRAVDRNATKNEIRDALLDYAAHNDAALSKAKADNLADKFKRGEYDPLLAYVLGYWDETGETAADNADAEGAAHKIRQANAARRIRARAA
jgi:hypothetical protein